MEPIASVIEEKTISFEFPHPPLLSPPLIALNKTSVGYKPGNPILQDVDLRIDMDDAILVGAPEGDDFYVAGMGGVLLCHAGEIHPKQTKLSEVVG